MGKYRFGLFLMGAGVIFRIMGSLDLGAALLGAGAAVAAMHDPYTREVKEAV